MRTYMNFNELLKNKGRSMTVLEDMAFTFDIGFDALVFLAQFQHDAIRKSVGHLLGTIPVEEDASALRSLEIYRKAIESHEIGSPAAYEIVATMSEVVPQSEMPSTPEEWVRGFRSIGWGDGDLVAELEEECE